jgi:NAD(P)H dehydrogenase (quinone)
MLSIEPLVAVPATAKHRDGKENELEDAMKVLWVVAHPQRRSLTMDLHGEGVRALVAQGHEVVTSDLYAMGWNPVVDVAEYGCDRAERVGVGAASREAYLRGGLGEDVRQEQDKLRSADAVVVQFPLWWFGMPAILKGWFDRVFVEGFAYGVRGDDGRTRRYGDGILAGKRAMVVVTTGGPEQVFGGRGINGALDELLFPIQHGTLFYAGATVVPPLLVPGADRLTAKAYAGAVAQLQERLRTLPTIAPVPYRRQNGGDYDADLVLRSDLAPGRRGVAVHVA